MPRTRRRTLALSNSVACPLRHALARVAVGGVLGALLFVGALPSAPSAQAIARPQPTCIRNVSLDRTGESDERHTIVLRDGRVEAILDADAPIPPATVVIDGEGLLALPAFLDAYTRTGCETPEPVTDQDVPVDVGADVRVDMRLANRKGIAPAFRAAEALALDADTTGDWREAGFGAALVSPGGQLLAGTSCVATTREAAVRDLVLRPDAFASATFDATGEGYPSTLMGYIAQFRQFFLDAERHRELVRRERQGRPGTRPPFDVDLEAGVAILDGSQRLLCEVETHRDVERWLKLADELGFEVAFAGGRDVWRLKDVLATRDVPVVLTLDWGKEVDDPRAAEKEKGEKPEASEADEGAAEEAPETAADPEGGAPEAPAAPGETQADEDEGEDAIEWEYEEPLGVRIARRAEWEETRDGAIRLHEVGVRLAFGTGGDKPAKLVERVRTLVEEGLPADVAMRALTSDAARILGVADRLGSLAPGHDATLVLWSADPLTEKKAKPAWVFVDGYPTEYDAPEDEAPKGEPAEGVTATGTWVLEVEAREGTSEVRLVLDMADDGSIEGVIHTENPRDESEVTSDVSGHMTGSVVRLSGELDFGEFQMSFDAELTIDGEDMSGEFTYTARFFPDGLVRSAEGSREPERAASDVETEHRHDHPHHAAGAR